jgi:hypothetical protein
MIFVQPSFHYKCGRNKNGGRKSDKEKFLVEEAETANSADTSAKRAASKWYMLHSVLAALVG